MKKIGIFVLIILFFIFLLYILSVCKPLKNNDSNYNLNFIINETNLNKNISTKICSYISECGFTNISEIYDKGKGNYLLKAGCYFEILIENDDVSWIKTYSTTMDIDSILLYSKTNGLIKQLTSEEISSFYTTQRKYIVNNSISITPNKGFLIHTISYSQYSFEIKNLSNTAIISLTIYTAPYILGDNTSSSKNIGHYYENTIYPGKTVKFTIKENALLDNRHDWLNYDCFKVIKVQIFWADGTAIELDNFDCQFLNC